MNKMREVAQLLGVELGEEFIINNGVSRHHYKLTEERGCIEIESGHSCYPMLSYLLCGEYSIEKIPFKPKNGEEYWSVFINIEGRLYVNELFFENSSSDFLRYKQELVFRTREEAKEIGIPKLKQIIDEFNNET